MKKNEYQKRNIKYGKLLIDYYLIYENRKDLQIKVDQEKKVIVKAPFMSDISIIEKKLLSKGSWVKKQISYYDDIYPFQSEREYIGGETHFYLGKQYRLKIINNSQNSVKLLGKYFIINCTEGKDKNKELLNIWYANHAKNIIDYRANNYSKTIIGEFYPKIKIQYKFMKKRWGSFSKTGIITFNIDLIKAPSDCIDYVIIHELCHILHPYHSKEFYKLLNKFLPNWKNRKQKLEDFSVNNIF